MVVDLLSLSIAIGLVVSLLFAETLGRAAGGLVVPGYLAFYLTQPWNIALTLAAAAATYAAVYALSSILIIYGKRRTVAMLLVGFLMGAAIRLMIGRFAPVGAAPVEYAVIGFIIPGLIAIWFDRQGILDTCCAALTATAVVRLVLVLVASAELHNYEMERKFDAVVAKPTTAGVAEMER